MRIKNTICLLCCLPLFALAQRGNLSADGTASLAKGLDATAFGLQVAGTVAVTPQLEAGLSTGIIKYTSFLKNLTVPLLARVALQSADDGERPVFFWLSEGGGLLYREDDFGGERGRTMRGGYTWFTGIGMKLPSQRSTRAVGTAGFTALHYHSTKGQPGLPASKTAYSLKRLTLRLGMTIPWG